MNVAEKLLQQFDVNLEDLNDVERDTFMKMLQDVNSSEMTPDKMQSYLEGMAFSVTQELTRHDLGSKQDIFLKARLRNYTLFLEFLKTPARAKAALENAMKKFVGLDSR